MIHWWYLALFSVASFALGYTGLFCLGLFLNELWRRR